MANMTPVTPPITKQGTKASAHSIAVVSLIRPFLIVKSQLNIFTPVGPAIIMVVMEKNEFPLTRKDVGGILYRGGTILGTSRTNPFKSEDTAEQAISNIKEMNFHAIVAVGGEDTLGVANKLSERGINVVGVPKTIDNDIMGTDFTFGFDTAVSIATEAVDRIHTTAESHHRVIVVEVMGRHAGWIATMAGIAGGADEILIPEEPYDIEEVCRNIQQRYDRGKTFSIICFNI